MGIRNCEVPISSRVVSTANVSIPANIDSATRLAAIPKVVLGHSIGMRLLIFGPWSEISVVFGTSENFRSCPGVIATLRRSSGGFIIHNKSVAAISASGGHRGSQRLESVTEIARYERNLREAQDEEEVFWLLWREGLLFVGAGAVIGADVLMVGDIANGIDRFENSSFVTDDVTGIFMASEAALNVACTFQALWVNNPLCRISRALCPVRAPALPAASAAMMEISDVKFNRIERTFAVVGADLRLINAVEIAWWLRFVFRPRDTKPKSILTSDDEDDRSSNREGRERRGRDIRVQNVHISADKKKFVVQASVTWEIWLSLIQETCHSIPKHPKLTNIRIHPCTIDGSFLPL